VPRTAGDDVSPQRLAFRRPGECCFVAMFATAGGALVGPVGCLAGRWIRGLLAGAGVHALAFGAVYLLWADPRPMAVTAWAIATGVAAGAGAGALGGAIRQRLDRGQKAQ